MTIDTAVYLKDKPDFGKLSKKYGFSFYNTRVFSLAKIKGSVPQSVELPEQLDFHEVERRFGDRKQSTYILCSRIWRWEVPKNDDPRGETVWITEDLLPPELYRAGDFEYLCEPQDGEAPLPKDLEGKLKRDDGLVVGDEEMFAILEKNRECMALPEIGPHLAIAYFAGGLPLYHAGIEAKIFASQATLQKVFDFSQYLLLKYRGIVRCDHGSGIGIPSAEDVHKLGSGAFQEFAQALGKWSGGHPNKKKGERIE